MKKLLMLAISAISLNALALPSHQEILYPGAELVSDDSPSKTEYSITISTKDSLEKVVEFYSKNTSIESCKNQTDDKNWVTCRYSGKGSKGTIEIERKSYGVTKSDIMIIE